MKRTVFLSYCRKDDAAGFVTELRNRLYERFRKRFPNQNLDIFFDSSSIEKMERWQLRIAETLRNADALIACVTPDYFGSWWCGEEWRRYSEREIEMGLPDGVGVLTWRKEGVGTGEPDATESDKEWRRALCAIQHCELWKATRGDLGRLKNGEADALLDVVCDRLNARFVLLDRARSSGTNLVGVSPKHFVGRRTELATLRDGLFGRATPAAALVHGLGGIGKSTLASAYAYLMRGSYPGGRWSFSAAGHHDLRALLLSRPDFWNLTLTDSQRLDPEAGFLTLLNHIRSQNGPMLLILDNVDHPQLLKGQDVSRLLDVNVHVLAVSRTDLQTAVGLPLIHVPVDKIREDEALRLFEAARPFKEKADFLAATELCRRLDGFPLGIATSASYLANRDGVSYSDYLRQLMSMGLDGLECVSDQMSPAEQSRSLSITLQPTLLELDDLEWEMVRWAAAMPIGFAALPWIRELAESWRTSATKRPAPAILSDFEKAVDRLEKFRLLVPAMAENCLEMHRIISEVVLSSSIAEARGRPLVEGERNIPRDQVVDLIGSRARRYCQPLIPVDTQWEIDPLVAAARLLLKLESDNAPQVADRVSRPLAEVHGRYLEAADLMNRAVDLLQERNTHDGNQSVDALTLISWLNLIGLDLKLCRLEEALDRCGTVESILERAGVDEPAILNSFNVDYATCLQLTGNYQAAAERFNKVIEAESGQAVPSRLVIDAQLGLSRCALAAAFLAGLPGNALEAAPQLISAAQKAVSATLSQVLSRLAQIQEDGHSDPADVLAEALLNMSLFRLLQQPGFDMNTTLEPVEKLISDSKLHSSPLLPRIHVARAISDLNQGRIQAAVDELKLAAAAEVEVSGVDSWASKELEDLAAKLPSLIPYSEPPVVRWITSLLSGRYRRATQQRKSAILVLKAFLYLGSNAIRKLPGE